MQEITDFTIKESFDIGFGKMVPDPEIMRTGKVKSEIYFSPERFEIEREMFRTAWLWAGRVEQIKQPGDWFVKELEVCNASIIITRHKDDSIRAFHNVCSHRGMRLKWEESGHNNLITCPYHAWTFSTDGSLKVITDEAFFPHACKDELGLKAVHVDVWAGFIFINLDPSPSQTLREFLGPIADRWTDAPFGDFTVGATVSETLHANWKLGADASSEAYHVFSLHSKSCKEWVIPAHNPFMHFIGWETIGPHRLTSIPTNRQFEVGPKRPVQKFAWSNVAHVVIRPTGETSAKVFGDRPDINMMKSPDWANDAYFLYPTTTIFASTNGWFIQEYLPLTIDTTRYTTTWYYRPARTCREQFAMQYSVVNSRDVTSEDLFSVRGQHLGLTSGAFKHIQFGGAETIPRHIAAVMQAVADGIQNKAATANGRQNAHVE
jgi:phenylpropionate dioxygenase-like ring-hydroxylating dioxygenase large terminal subunit